MPDQSASEHTITVQCHECELIVDLPPLADGDRALCPRCGYELAQHRHYAEQRILSYALSALIFLMLALTFKFMSFQASGQVQSVSIPEVITVLIDNQYLPLAIITGIAIVALPAVILIGLIYILLPAHFGVIPPKAKRVLDGIYVLLPWSMAEIFLISVLVSLVKIKSMAEVEMGLSFYAYVMFTLCMTAMTVYMDKVQLYRLVGAHPHPPRVSSTPEQDAQRSIQRTWALLITSVILYIPANVLPIMYTRWLGQDDPQTILGGVVVLWQYKSYAISLIILMASVVVPVAKIVILAWLNYTVQKGHLHLQEERIRFYRWTEFIGRWSMVDVFVVAILVALIQLGNTMAVFPGPAAMAFCGVVFVTMLAAITFDSKLIWKQGHISVGN